jgi:hypothetical protein
MSAVASSCAADADGLAEPHHGPAVAGEAPEQGRDGGVGLGAVAVRAHQHQRVDLLGDEGAQGADLGVDHAVGLGEQHLGLRGEDLLLDLAGDGREVGVRDVVHDQADQARAGARERLGLGVGDVAEAVRGGADPLGDLLAGDAGRAVEDPGGGGERDARILGDIAEAHGGHRGSF